MIIIALIASLISIAYMIFAISQVLAFRTPRKVAALSIVPATILKPVCGLQPDLYENLRSFCDQDYACYQVVFGIRSATDPAVELIKRLIAALPEQDLSLVVDEQIFGSNLKVSNLINMQRAAKYEFLVIADSDMRVGRDYLAAVMALFQNPVVGVVTCLYKGSPAKKGLPSLLGAMFINDWFAPAVLVALRLQPLNYCFGATMAVRKDALAAIGGFAALAYQLADDHMLGKLVAAKGYQVELCPYIVENRVWEPDLKALLLHELRWSRTIRAMQPLGHAFSFLTNPVAISLLFILVAPEKTWGYYLLSVSVLLRVLLHYSIFYSFHISGLARPWLTPVRDVLCFAVWAASFFGRNVRWGEHDFSVQSGGYMSKKGMPK